MAVADHLLRTLASVAPGTRIAEVGCGDGRHTAPLVQLGFDVWACDADPTAVTTTRARLNDVGVEDAARRVAVMAPGALGFPDAYADWGVMTTLPAERPERDAAFQEALRVLRPGAWLWVGTGSAEGLVESAAAAGFVVAEAPASDADGVHAIFRRPAAVG